MKLRAILFLLNFAMIWCLFSIAWPNAKADGLPAPWMHASQKMPDVLKPESLSGADQEKCIGVILGEINARMGTSLRRENVTPVQMKGWEKPESGFVRGGGFNIRVVATLPAAEASRIHVKPGRFSDVWTFLELGVRPSLHVPDAIDDQKTFMKAHSANADTVSFDFVAHTDSAYAYLPFGFITHEFRDILGADGRDPCPMEGDVAPEED